VPPKQQLFDLHRLSTSIDRARIKRQLTWAEVSKDVGVATSTIRRFSSATDAEADGVLALVGWLGVPPEHFVAESRIDGIHLPPRGEGVIRVDMAMVMDALSMKHSGRPRTRTTIQRLTLAALAAGTSISSLTRWCAV